MGVLREKSFEPEAKTPLAINVAFFGVLTVLGLAFGLAIGLIPNLFAEKMVAPPVSNPNYVEPWRQALEESRSMPVPAAKAPEVATYRAAPKESPSAPEPTAEE